MFNFGSKPATTFTLTATTSVPAAGTGAGGFTFGGSGDKTQATKPATALFGSSTSSFAFGTTTPTAVATPFAAPVTSVLPLGSSIGTPTTTSAPIQLSFGSTSTTTSSFTPIVSTGISSAVTGLSSGLQFGPTTPNTNVTSATSGGTPALSVSAVPTKLTFPQPAISSTNALSAIPLAPTAAPTIIPATGTLTYNQLEDTINKWTVDLEEQSKHFLNQTKQLNAWDTLLISNGDKIISLNNSIERVKQEQQQLDQELDFVLAQQKDLEELVGPLEKELASIPQTADQERNRTYQLAESMDSQLKQMSEDLKGIIEHLNESNKEEDANDPINQISRILNAHMNSLQWIDRNTGQISSYLEQISKMQDISRRNNAIEM